MAMSSEFIGAPISVEPSPTPTRQAPPSRAGITRLRSRPPKTSSRPSERPARCADGVPTNSLFIEVLPGADLLLENFKLRHRELDVYKVQGNFRKAGLEALRLASRLINGERKDPDIEKHIPVEGTSNPS